MRSGDSDQRKSSKDKPAKSRFSRKAVKNIINDFASDDSHTNNGKQSEQSDENKAKEPSPARPPLVSSNTASVIPDPLNELPSWFHRDGEPTITTAAQYRIKYPLHNRSGPRFYYNFHLLPVHDNTPPAQFSTSFPPIISAAERSQESTRIPALSRTPSGSPLPTPDSSQLRVNEPGNKLRTRKLSQTAHDEVDLLDGSDPWGTNWHHHSPYDIGLNTEFSADETTLPRSRRLSLNTDNPHRSVIPSPLSQSTSAVHLHSLDNPQIPRRLSKRHRPFVVLFGGGHNNQNSSAHQRAVTAPAGDGVTRKNSRRKSVMGPPLSPSANRAAVQAHAETGKKEKRGSFMNRLAKRFSVQKKTEPVNHAPEPLLSGTPPSTSDEAAVHSVKSVEPIKRVPPPTFEDGPAAAPESSSKEERRRSGAPSVEEHASLGNLTIANPDQPAGNERTAADVSAPAHEAPAHPHVTAQPVLDGPVSSSPISVEHELPPIPASQPAVLPAEPPNSPPLPPLPSLELQEHTLPPTPGPEPSLPPSPSTNVVSSVGHTHIRDALSYTVSQSGLTYATSLDSMDNTPRSRASILANPPTPYASPRILPTKLKGSPRIDVAKATETPMLPPKGKDAPGVQHSKSSSATKRRETETFKLIRSPSGREHAVGDVIPGMGMEQWEVVESPTAESPKRTRTKHPWKSNDHDDRIARQDSDSKRKEGDSHSGRRASNEDERERERRAEHHESSRRQNHSSSTDDSDRLPRSLSRRSPPREQTGSGDPPSADSAPRPSGKAGVAFARKESRSTSGQRGESGNDRIRGAKSTSTSTAHHRKHPSQSSVSVSVGVERRTSASTRPTSEVQPTADLHTLKAKEAWDMERLWKARSLYGPDGAPIVTIPPANGDSSRPSTFMSADMHRAGTIPSTSDLHMHRATSLPDPAPAHGSNHTYYMVQPHQAHHNAAYSQIPAPPPPILYSSSQPQPQPAQASPPRTRTKRSNSDHIPFPSINTTNDPRSLTRTFLANPLPDPPRVSQFQAAPLPPSLRADAPASPPMWAQYAGVATARN